MTTESVFNLVVNGSFTALLVFIANRFIKEVDGFKTKIVKLEEKRSDDKDKNDNKFDSVESKIDNKFDSLSSKIDDTQKMIKLGDMEIKKEVSILTVKM
mgnify:FL=1